MTLAVFISAALALLVAPGPTNTLMGIAGAQHGLFRVLRLLPAELAGYLTTVLPLTYLGAQTLGRLPAVTVAMKLIAAIWVLYLALKLWRFHGPEGEAARVTARKIYVNPDRRNSRSATASDRRCARHLPRNCGADRPRPRPAGGRHLETTAQGPDRASRCARRSRRARTPIASILPLPTWRRLRPRMSAPGDRSPLRSRPTCPDPRGKSSSVASSRPDLER